MILLDTSVWVDHLRNSNEIVTTLLDRGQVLTHPFVVGELACGSIRNRDEILLNLLALPSAPQATDAEVLSLIDNWRLWGRGLGWVDAHLLASARLAKKSLWSYDKAVVEAARELLPFQ